MSVLSCPFCWVFLRGEEHGVGPLDLREGTNVDQEEITFQGLEEEVALAASVWAAPIFSMI